MGYKVYFTTHAFVQLLREIEDFTGIETGGIFIGKRIGNVFYVFECVDSGIHCERSEVEFERDYQYTEHLSYVVASMYEGAKPIGYYHRHPGNYNRFSGGDGASNKEMSRLLGGCISGLVTIFPKFQLNLWYVDLNGQLFSADDYEVNDRAFTGVLFLKNYAALINSIERNEYEFNVRRGRFRRDERFEEELARLKPHHGVGETEQARSMDGDLEVSSFNHPGNNIRQDHREGRKGLLGLCNRHKPVPHECKTSTNLSEESKRIYKVIAPEFKKLLKNYDIVCGETSGRFTIKVFNDDFTFVFLMVEKLVDGIPQLFLNYNDSEGERREVLYRTGMLNDRVKKTMR